MKKCLHCKKNIPNHRNYCSHKCANIATGPARRKRIVISCEVCSKAIEVTPGQLKVRKIIRFCSRECSAVGLSNPSSKVEVICNTCNKLFTKYKLKVKNTNYCSKACHIKAPRPKRKGYWYESGYIVEYISPNKSIKQHIKVMQEHIGRKLKKDEVVHHVNNKRDDNRIENLQLMTRAEHTAHHRKESLDVVLKQNSIRKRF